MKTLINNSFNYIIALLAGACLPAAFAPLSLWPISFISLSCLLFVWHKATFSQAFIYGFLFGLGFFGIGVSWVFVSIHVYGYTTPILAALLTTLFIICLSLFPALQGILFRYLGMFTEKSKFKTNFLIIVFPIVWVFFEWFRSWFLTGFPWLFIGYSQIDTPLKFYAPIFGVYGISYLVAFSASLLLFLVHPKFKHQFTTAKKSFYWLLLLGIWIGGFCLKNINWTTAESGKPSISMVQGNIKPDDKFIHIDPITEIWNIYGQKTLQELERLKFKDPNNSKLIIWPENSLPVPYPYSKNFLDHLGKIALDYNATLILGLPEQAPDNSDNFYNALRVVGQGQGKYYKQHLVPFGEYLPFASLLRGLINFFNLPMSNFIQGPETKPLEIPNLKLLPQICYEIAYPKAVHKALKQSSASAILNISEDGWFGNSWGPHQHLEIARMRALETGRYVLRSTTCGISAIIDNQGNIIKQSPQFTATSLNGEFKVYWGNTPWVKFGYLPLCGLIMSFFFMFYNTSKKNIISLLLN